MRNWNPGKSAMTKEKYGLDIFVVLFFNVLRFIIFNKNKNDNTQVMKNSYK